MEVGPIQTFLPYADFEKSVATLDQKRLGKQRVETFQVIQTITGVRHNPTLLKQGVCVLERFDPKGWTRHPVCRMWAGHVDHLLRYQLATCGEWTSRGYKDTCESKSLKVFVEAVHLGLVPAVTVPPFWLGRDDVHQSHRDRLVAKLPEHYGPQFADADPTKEYVWPV